MFGKQRTTDEVRVVTTSVVGSTFHFDQGDAWVIPPGCDAPDVLKRHSTVYDGPAPINAKRFDPVEWQSRTSPRTKERIADDPLVKEPDLLQQLHWTPDQLSVAIGGCGFPAPSWVLDTPLHGRKRRWQQPQVDHWIERLQSLGFEKVTS